MRTFVPGSDIPEGADPHSGYEQTTGGVVSVDASIEEVEREYPVGR